MIETYKSGEIDCPLCNEKLIAKCGNFNIWHWSHKNNSNCLYETNKGKWHIEMQNLFDIKYHEVKKNNTIADVLLDSDVCIEFQNSPILLDEILKRNQNYRITYWVFNELNCEILKRQNYIELTYPKMVYFKIDNLFINIKKDVFIKVNKKFEDRLIQKPYNIRTMVIFEYNIFNTIEFISYFDKYKEPIIKKELKLF